MRLPIEALADACHGRSMIAIPGYDVRAFIIDHRDIHWKSSVFVAIIGKNVDGHDFIPDLIHQGVRNFIISDESVANANSELANFIIVENVVTALQQIAKAHRKAFNKPVIGITGSNGKTIVKEWLNHILESSFQICRSPKSYNSQIGVALSLLNLDSQHNLGIFEAGISMPEEMHRLQHMIEPSIGIFTNLGDAHSAHFDNNAEKLYEKLILFDGCKSVILNEDQFWYSEFKDSQLENGFTWSQKNSKASVFVSNIDYKRGRTAIFLTSDSKDYQIEIPFDDRASIENAIHCFCACLLLKCTSKQVLDKFKTLRAVSMRMELKQGIENSILIDDSYNNDLGSLIAALEQLSNQKVSSRMVILSDLHQNEAPQKLYHELAELINEAAIDELVIIGPEIGKFKDFFKVATVRHFADADDFWFQLDTSTLRNQAILIKGARAFKLEQLVNRLKSQHHATRLEVDLHKLGQNLDYFRSRIEAKTKIMVMVKAFAYGSGGYEVANYLQSKKVDYLAVAYADEGVELRKKGIRIPMMVMSPTRSAYETIIRHQLEAEIYSLRSLGEFIESASSLRHLFDTLSIHIKVDTGMHRLGFEEQDISYLIEKLASAPFIRVASIFTHLSAADNEVDDDFTDNQIAAFKQFSNKLEGLLGYTCLKHALNTTGLLRFPDRHFDMVRIGIGLYGFAGSEHSKYLQALGAFKSYIIQIRTVDENQSVGYNRSGIKQESRRIATVAVGYADGLDRRLGNGNWSIKWQAADCPIVGNVCMDMCMIDVTKCEAKEGDEVVIFNGSIDVEKMAQTLNTIPYEILTKISQRVTRVYMNE